MEVIVWSKDNCQYCDMAKKLLTVKNLGYEERNISGGRWTKEDLLAVAPSARSVPQIFIDGVLVGGYNELNERLK